MSPSTTPDHRQFAAEIKFLVAPDVADRIRTWARRHLAPDPNAGGRQSDRYRITSLYLDNADYDVFRRRGSYGRSKYRIRRYGEEAGCFLERKLRTSRLLAKRRSRIGLGELPSLGATTDGESRWFARRLRLRGLRPLCQVSYERTARVAMTTRGPIRLTLDEDLRALPAGDFAFQEPGRVVLPDHVILELKFLVQMPTLFKNLAEEFGLNSRRFSKYRRSAFALGLVPWNDVSAEVPTANSRIPAYA